MVSAVRGAFASRQYRAAPTLANDTGIRGAKSGEMLEKRLDNRKAYVLHCMAT
jgi:hypothetical protein